MYVMDTNVISEIRKPRPHGAVLAWLESVPNESLYLSAVSLAELQAGVELTRERDLEKAAEIEAWIETLPETYRVLALDGPSFRLWARLMHRKPTQIYVDAMIAATAIVHGFVVATRNVHDFQPFGVPILNPFEPPLR